MSQKIKPSAGRTRTRDIVTSLRNRILHGHWPPNTRIPTKLELARALGASHSTVQLALDKLTKQGFLRSRGHLGTWVCERPPHLYRVGLVTDSPCVGIWLNTLRTVAEQLSHNGHHSLECYFDCHRDGDTLSSRLQELEADIVDSRLAGVICTTRPEALAGTQVISWPGLARLVMTSHDTGSPWPTISWPLAYPRAMQRFQELGCRRLGIITTFHFGPPHLDPILQSAREHGLETRRAWNHFFDECYPYTTMPVAELLMSLPREQRPDALYIMDDHLVVFATAGVANAGIRAPEDLTIIAHANFPAIQPALAPVTYLGFDQETILRTALEIIDRQLKNQPVPHVTKIESVFDFERPPQSTSPPGSS